MKNGYYEIESKTLSGLKYNLVTHNGSYKLFMPILNAPDQFIRNTTWQTIQDNFNVVKTLKKPKGLYNIEWIINGVRKELIRVNATYPVVSFKINELKRSAYKIGLLKMILTSES